ncbi:MAG TPA: hypothetical protein VHO03_08055 [Ignavibacteriales bacterium]|nr:hypothetical protein [Ignavibacteriales bacterium]
MKLEVFNSIISGLALIGTAITSYVVFKNYKKNIPQIVKVKRCLETVDYLLIQITSNNANGLAIKDVVIRRRYLGIIYGSQHYVSWKYGDNIFAQEQLMIKETGYIRAFPSHKYMDKACKLVIKTTSGNCHWKIKIESIKKMEENDNKINKFYNR